MAYIVLVNPQILSAAGMDGGAVFVATCLAPALFFVACLIARGFAELVWDDVTEYAPAVVTAPTMPLTFSITNRPPARCEPVNAHSGGYICR